MKNIFLYLDKKGAEWVVVAFLAGDARMMEVCESGANPHIITASHMFGVSPDVILRERELVDDAAKRGETGTMGVRNARVAMAAELAPAVEKLFPNLPPQKDKFGGLSLLPPLSLYACGKRTNHGCDYREGYKGFALMNGLTESISLRIVEAYTNKAETRNRLGRRAWEYGGVYPGIARWWDETDELVKRDKALTSCWGRKIPFMGTQDTNLFRKAYSAIPQSTVVDLVDRAMVNAFRTRSPAFTRARLMQQTHDSLTYEYPLDALPAAAEFISSLAFGERYMNPVMEYGGRGFRIGTDMKVGFSLGAMHDCPITPNPGEQLEHLTRAVAGVKAQSPYWNLARVG